MATEKRVKTIEEDFAVYFAACYPKGAPPLQKVEVRQAFMAGILTAFGKPREWVESGITNQKKLQKLAAQTQAQAVDALNNRVTEMRQRN